MFNSTILDVAIGMIFVYLLLSLMCSAANEIIELLLKKRAIDLERGIRELLAPGTKSGTNDVVQQLYNHPLVNSLFGGKYETSRIENVVKRKLMRTALPSYIPARTFALALMDLVLPGVTPAPGAAGATPVTGVVPGAPSGAAGATPPPANFSMTLTAPPPPSPAIGTMGNPLTALRTAIGTSPLPDHARTVLTSLIDAAGTDVAKARENIEGWFNSSMDRVSSWYKRRTQIIILIVGLVITIAINADTIAIARKLATDKSLRESLVAAAQQYARAQADSATPATARASTAPAVGSSSPQPQSSPATAAGAASSPSPTVTASPAVSPNTRPSGSPVASPAASPAASPVASPTPLPECTSDKNSPQCKYATLLQSIPECARDKESAECKYAVNQKQLESLGLPIGWGSVDDPQHKWPGLDWSSDHGWKKQLYSHLPGWLLTALAISLGAPFWFDLLNKFIVIRSAVKPHEKSPEEESKD